MQISWIVLHIGTYPSLPKGGTTFWPRTEDGNLWASPSTSQRTVHKLIPNPRTSPSHALTSSFAKIHLESLDFSGPETPPLLAQPCNELFSAPNSTWVSLASLGIRYRNLCWHACIPSGSWKLCYSPTCSSSTDSRGSWNEMKPGDCQQTIHIGPPPWALPHLILLASSSAQVVSFQAHTLFCWRVLASESSVWTALSPALPSLLTWLVATYLQSWNHRTTPNWFYF